MRIFVGFSRKRIQLLNPLGLLIMAFERIPFSHCYIRFETELGSRVYESAWPESRTMEFGKWLRINKPIKEFELNLSGENATKFIAATYSQLGTPYSLWQLVTISAWILTKKYYFKNESDNDIKSNICTELVAHSLMTQGVQFKRDTDFLLLKDIYKACRLLTCGVSNGNIS